MFYELNIDDNIQFSGVKLFFSKGDLLYEGKRCLDVI